MSLEFILLGMLKQPATGYDLKAAFEAGYRHFWSAELSQIYPTLQQMERRGLLKSKKQPSARGPERRVYERTTSGTRALQHWLASEPIMGTERFAYLGQLAFMSELNDPSATATFLSKLHARLDEFARLLEAVESEMKSRAGVPDSLDNHEFHDFLCLRIGTRSVRAKAAACEEGITLARARTKSRTKRIPHA